MGYCTRCDKQSEIQAKHHCHTCYSTFCESCYFNEVYEDDTCMECFERISCKPKRRRINNLYKPYSF